jgi:hypothetical protein
MARKDLEQIDLISPLLYPPTISHRNFDNPDNEVSCYPSRELSQICEVIYIKEIKVKYDKKARETAIKLMRDLFLTRKVDIAAAVKNIPYIPDIPDLREVRLFHEKQLSGMTLDETLRVLCSLLQHDFSFVRMIVLKKICTVFVENRGQIFSVLSGGELKDAVFVLPRNSSLRLLLQELLQLCARETDAEVIEKCSRCLGKKDKST